MDILRSTQLKLLWSENPSGNILWRCGIAYAVLRMRWPPPQHYRGVLLVVCEEVKIVKITPKIMESPSSVVDDLTAALVGQNSRACVYAKFHRVRWKCEDLWSIILFIEHRLRDDRKKRSCFDQNSEEKDFVFKSKSVASLRCFNGLRMMKWRSENFHVISIKILKKKILLSNQSQLRCAVFDSCKVSRLRMVFVIE